MNETCSYCCRGQAVGMPLSEIRGEWRLQAPQRWRTYIRTCRTITAPVPLTPTPISWLVKPLIDMRRWFTQMQTHGLAIALDEQWMRHGTSYQVRYVQSICTSGGFREQAFRDWILWKRCLHGITFVPSHLMASATLIHEPACWEYGLEAHYSDWRHNNLTAGT